MSAIVPVLRLAGTYCREASVVRRTCSHTARSRRLRCVARGRLRKERAHPCREVKNGFVPRILDEVFPALKALQTAQCPFKNLPEKKASRWGESLTADKLQQCRWARPRLVCRSRSSNGRMPGTCGIAPSSLCAMTKSPWRWFVRLESHRTGY
jgi:hypothetical protein